MSLERACPPERVPGDEADLRLEKLLGAATPGICALDLGYPVGGRSRYTICGLRGTVAADVGPDGSPEELVAALERAGQRRGSGAEKVPDWNGTVGFLSYDARHVFESAAGRRFNPDQPLLRLVELEDWLLADRAEQGGPRGPGTEHSAAPAARTGKPRVSLAECAELGRVEYADRVRAIQEDIAAGEYYELNFTQRFRVRSRALPAHVALRLRQRARAPYWTFLDFGDLAVISASPELFLRRDGDRIETKPIKGSARRGTDASADAALAEALRRDEKNAAEHTMVVDLARNDLGRLCRYGTVETRERAAVETFPTVHHLVSTVAGELRSGTTITDILRATFPAASITGAPKVQVMRAIDRYEVSPRGIYTGMIGGIASNGNLDLNVAIRTVVARRTAAGEYEYEFGAGGAIVADSDPEAEYEECLLKAQPLLDAILAAEGESVQQSPKGPL